MSCWFVRGLNIVDWRGSIITCGHMSDVRRRKGSHWSPALTLRSHAITQPFISDRGVHRIHGGWWALPFMSDLGVHRIQGGGHYNSLVTGAFTGYRGGGTTIHY